MTEKTEPWLLARRPNHIAGVPFDIIVKEDGVNRAVAWAGRLDEAEFIVAAHNNYYGLLEALRVALGELQAVSLLNSHLDMSASIKKVRAAISKAEGKPTEWWVKRRGYWWCGPEKRGFSTSPQAGYRFTNWEDACRWAKDLDGSVEEVS